MTSDKIDYSITITTAVKIPELCDSILRWVTTNNIFIHLFLAGKQNTETQKETVVQPKPVNNLVLVFPSICS